MRKILWAGVAALGLAAVVTARADSGWGFYGSYWDAGDLADTYGAGGDISMEMIPNVRLDVRCTVFSNVNLENAAGKSSLDITPLDAMLLVVIPAGERWNVYGGGGISYYFVSADFTPNPGVANVAVDSDDEIGGLALVGAEFNVVNNKRLAGSTRTTLFTEVTGRFLEANNAVVTSATAPAADDASLNGVGANVGLMIRW